MTRTRPCPSRIPSRIPLTSRLSASEGGVTRFWAWAIALLNYGLGFFAFLFARSLIGAAISLVVVYSLYTKFDLYF